MTSIAILVASFLAACASAPALTGSVCHHRAVTFAEVGVEPRWRLVPGTDTVIVVFTEDATPNEELVVQLPPDLVAAGGSHPFSAAVATYYQRGGQILTFASRRVSGTLALAPGGVNGTADLVAEEPEVDINNDRKVSRRLVFEANVNDGLCR